jgi:hypothetical protein
MLGLNPDGTPMAKKEVPGAMREKSPNYEDFIFNAQDNGTNSVSNKYGYGSPTTEHYNTIDHHEVNEGGEGRYERQAQSLRAVRNGYIYTDEDFDPKNFSSFNSAFPLNNA